VRVLVAGATGVIGRQLVPLLREAGHDAVALARSQARASVLDIDVVTADALDRPALEAVVQRTAPDVIVHLLTAIPQHLDPKRFAAQMEGTNRLRIEATANLVAAAGHARLITQGIAFAYRPGGAQRADEAEPLWDDGPKPFRKVVAALRRAEMLTLDNAGTVLRFGHLYGPATPFAPDGAIVEQLRAARFPVVGQGDGMFSFVHTRDAAAAVVAAIDSERRGTFNIVDDEPAPVRTWLPYLARLAGAPAPRRVPRVAARLAAGAWGVAYLTALVGADNARASRELGWRPSFSTWRDGFFAELVPPMAAPSNRPRIGGSPSDTQGPS
jgi:nucleoside-diphosphate-sugar epimerase